MISFMVMVIFVFFLIFLGDKSLVTLQPEATVFDRICIVVVMRFLRCI